jgi:hypothetical protein
MSKPINTTELRRWAEYQRSKTPASSWETPPARAMLALLDTVEAAHEMADAYEAIAVYPEGSVGFENANEAHTALRQALARFTSQENT